jgi:hypothetical protein
MVGWQLRWLLLPASTGCFEMSAALCCDEEVEEPTYVRQEATKLLVAEINELTSVELICILAKTAT